MYLLSAKYFNIQVFSAQAVAKDLVNGSTEGYYGISTGLDGWLLKQLHPGMSPANHSFEVLQQLLFAPLCRYCSVQHCICTVFYILHYTLYFYHTTCRHDVPLLAGWAFCTRFFLSIIFS